MKDKTVQEIIGILKSREFTQSEIADRVGCSKSTLSRVYGGGYCNPFIHRRLELWLDNKSYTLLRFSTTHLKKELILRGQNIFS